MRVFGLIGFPLSHSFSAEYFREKFRKEGITGACYRNFPLNDIHEFPHLLCARPELAGLNVTIPYKESIIPFLDNLDPVAGEVGAVNVVSFAEDRKMTGHNTDVEGFRQSLLPHLNDRHDRALILGTGGASKSVARVLEKLGIPFVFASRTPVGKNEYPYSAMDAGMIREHRLIIQTTPLGMHPEPEGCPLISFDGIGPDHLLFDLVYNPSVTRFMEKGMAKGAVAVNGLEMLRIQAEEAWKIWNR